MLFFKACEKNFTITNLNVVEVQSEHLIIESKNKYDGLERIQRIGVNYICVDNYEAALRHLISLSTVKLNSIRKELKEAIITHSKLENMIDNDQLLSQVA